MHSACLIVFACNFFRYFKIIPFKKAEEIWRYEEADIKRKRGWGIIIYIIQNIMITILLSLFRNFFS